MTTSLGAKQPGTGGVSVDDILQATDLIASIRKVIAGQWTQQELGTWAHHALLNDLNGVVPIDHRDSLLITKTLERLMSLAEGPEYTLDAETLEAIAKELGG